MATKICVVYTDEKAVKAVLLPKDQPDWKITNLVKFIEKSHQDELNRAWKLLYPNREPDVDVSASVKVIDLVDEDGNQISCLSPVKDDPLPDAKDGS